MKIAIATDHRGRELKLEIIEKLKADFDFVDCSTLNTASDDYPDFAFKTCETVIEGKADFGVLICGTGIGMSIAANKVKGIRCALVHDGDEAHLAKEHNHANVIAFGSKLGLSKIVEYIKIYAAASTMGENHERRVNKIIKYERGEYNEL